MICKLHLLVQFYESNVNVLYFIVQVLVSSCGTLRTAVFEVDSTAACSYCSLVGAGHSGCEL